LSEAALGLFERLDMRIRITTPGSGPNGKGSLAWSGTPVSPNGRSVVAALAFKAVAVAPAVIAPKKARLSIVSSVMACF
jgi:hypothetical protein